MATSSSKAKRKSGPLNGFFHYAERGGTFGGEIVAGLTMAFLAVCGIFLNMQIISTMLLETTDTALTGTQLAANGETYALIYFVSMIVAFVGSLAVGLIARLPLVLVSGMGLSTVLVALVGTSSGLTYYNLLFVSLVSSVIFAVVAGIPAIRQFVYKALPAPVRRVLPAAAGLLLAFVAVQLSGVVTLASSAIANYGAGTELEAVSDTVVTSGIVSLSNYTYATDALHPQLMAAALSAILAVVVYLLIRRRSKRPVMISLLVATVVFLLVCVLACGVNWNNFKFSLDFLWGRAWMVGSEDAMQLHLSTVFSSLSIGAVLTEGTDFSAFTEAGGNVVTLFACAFVSFVFLNLYETESTLAVVVDSKTSGVSDSDLADPKRADAYAPTMIVTAATSIVGALVGASPVTIGKASFAGKRDGAKSGLASVVAAIVFLVSAFVMLVPAVFSTAYSYSITANLYGHYGTTLAYVCECSFAVADMVMVVVGLGMVARTLSAEWSLILETAGTAAKESAESGADPEAIAKAAQGAMRPTLAEIVPGIATVVGTLLTTNIACGAALGTISYFLIQALPPKAKKRKGKKSKAPKGAFLARVGGVPVIVWTVVSVALLALYLVI